MTNSELIQTIDFDDMLLRLSKNENLLETDIISIEKFLEQNIESNKKRSLEDLFAALTVLSKNDKPDHAYLVEKFLNLNDPIIIELALETLIFKWGLDNDYEEIIIKYLLGVPFDYDGDLKEKSILIVGNLINKNLDEIKDTEFPLSERDLRLISLLIQIIEDKNEENFIKETAISSLYKSSKKLNSLLSKSKAQYKNLCKDDKDLLDKFNLYSSSSSLESETELSDIELSEEDMPETGIR
jgi:hypothetical protein